MDLGIAGKSVLVTGGSKNLGAAVAKAFAAEGCSVTLVSRDSSKLQAVLGELGRHGSGHDYLAMDLLTPGAPTRVVNELFKRGHSYDIVVHNVGGALGHKDPLGPVEDWHRVWVFNVGIAIEMNRLLIPPMQKKRWGRLIHVSSIAAEQGDLRRGPFGGAHAYAAAKAYLNAYVKGLGREMASDNIIVAALMPGALLSSGKYWDELRRKNPELVQSFLEQHSAGGRFGTAEEIAPFAVFLASAQATFAAGSLLSIDGGRM